MGPNTSIFPLAACAATAALFVAAILMISDFAYADEANKATGGGQCTCPDSGGNSGKLWSRPKFADLQASDETSNTRLDLKDEIATLETLQMALSEVGDGSTYVWHRYHGRLSGVIKPTTSFKDGSGQVCRHVIVVLTSGSRSQRSEGIACRLATGQWQLQG
jgi:surface antigen